MRFEYIRDALGIDAVEHHAFALAIENSERQILILAFPRNDLIDRIFSRIIRPGSQLAIVGCIGTIKHETLDLRAVAFGVHLHNLKNETQDASVPSSESADRNHHGARDS
jgi:hypothetical protein